MRAIGCQNQTRHQMPSSPSCSVRGTMTPKNARRSNTSKTRSKTTMCLRRKVLIRSLEPGSVYCAHYNFIEQENTQNYHLFYSIHFIDKFFFCTNAFLVLCSVYTCTYVVLCWSIRMYSVYNTTCIAAYKQFVSMSKDFTLLQ